MPIASPVPATSTLEEMKNPLSNQNPRPRVRGLVVPRRPSPKFFPADLGRQKGTVPLNPFSGLKQPVLSSQKLEGAVKQAMSPMTRTIGGAVIGGIGGGRAGYKLTRDDTKRKRNTAAGVASGAVGGALLGRYAKMPSFGSKPDPEAARRAAEERLKDDPQYQKLKREVSRLESLVGRMKSGEDPDEVLAEVIRKRKAYFRQAEIIREAQRNRGEKGGREAGLQNFREAAMDFARPRHARALRGEEPEVIHLPKEFIEDILRGTGASGEKNATAPLSTALFRAAVQGAKKEASKQLSSAAQLAGKAGKAVGGFVGRHPILSTVGAASLYAAPDLVKRFKKSSESESARSGVDGTAHRPRHTLRY